MRTSGRSGLADRPLPTARFAQIRRDINTRELYKICTSICGTTQGNMAGKRCADDEFNVVAELAAPAKRLKLECEDAEVPDGEDVKLMMDLERPEQTAVLDNAKHSGWTLSPADIPRGSKKIYCVLRGRQPGFYYDYSGPNGAEAQVSGFADNLFQSFPRGKKPSIHPGNVQQVIHEALRYMSHDSTSCSYGCGGKCAAIPATAALNLNQPQKARVPKGPSLKVCRCCGRNRSVHRGRVCQSCLSSTKLASPLDKCIKEFNLNSEQAQVLSLVAQGRNCFFTGAAGTGKSRVVEAIVSYLKRIELEAKVVAPTGMAALNVYGTTLHMYAGWTVKLAQSSLEDLSGVAHEKKVRRRFEDTDVLIIDEVSMVESNMLTRLSHMMQTSLRDTTLPFGGVQIVSLRYHPEYPFQQSELIEYVCRSLLATSTSYHQFFPSQLAFSVATQRRRRPKGQAFTLARPTATFTMTISGHSRMWRGPAAILPLFSSTRFIGKLIPRSVRYSRLCEWELDGQQRKKTCCSITRILSTLAWQSS